jgi:hypothetical protein
MRNEMRKSLKVITLSVSAAALLAGAGPAMASPAGTVPRPRITCPRQLAGIRVVAREMGITIGSTTILHDTYPNRRRWAGQLRADQLGELAPVVLGAEGQDARQKKFLVTEALTSLTAAILEYQPREEKSPTGCTGFAVRQ